MRAHLTWTWCLFVLLALAAAPAFAEPAFQWTAPKGCPSSDAVRARIERRLGAPVDGSVHGIAITVARENREYVARIDMRGVTVANEMRTLTSARCDELADAVAVVVARLATEARRAAVAPAPAAEPPASATTSTTAITARDTVAPHAGPWGGGLRAMFLSGIGSVPRVGVGGELAAFVRHHHWFAEIGGARWATTPKYLVMGVPNHVDIELTTLIVRAGWLSTVMPLRGWLGGEMGPMTARNVDMPDPDTRVARVATSRWVAVEAGFGVAWPMAEHARIVGTFEVGVPIVRPEFMLAEGGEIFRPYPTTARCTFGLEMGWR